MIFIQLIDLTAGISNSATGVVALSDSLLPLFNAPSIAGLLSLWRPKFVA
jgi:hypothetical protein